MQKIMKALKYFFLAILVFLVLVFLSVFIQTKVNPNKIPSVFGYKPFIVLSGSMETELHKGDLAIVKKVDTDTLKVNDIIAFRDENKRVVTHRIVSIIDNNSNKEFITKGDNNNTNDTGSVSMKSIEGKYVHKIKGLGSVLLFIKKPTTLIITLLFIIVVGTLWILIGNNKLTNEERKELEQLRKEKETIMPVIFQDQ